MNEHLAGIFYHLDGEKQVMQDFLNSYTWNTFRLVYYGYVRLFRAAYQVTGKYILSNSGKPLVNPW